MTIQDARQAVGKSLGLYFFDGSASAYRDLSADDQVKVSDGLAAYIVSNPGAFTDTQVTEARRVASSPGFRTGLADTSFNFEMFGNEVVNNAAKITETGADIFKKLIYLAVVAGLLAYLLPTFLTRLHRGKVEAKKEESPSA